MPFPFQCLSQPALQARQIRFPLHSAARPRRGAPCRLHDFADKPVAASMNRFDVKRVLAAVVQGFAQFGHRHLEDGLANVCFRPDRVQKFVLCNQPRGMLQQVAQHTVRLARDHKGIRTQPDALVGGIETVRRENDWFLGGQDFPQFYQPLPRAPFTEI